MSSFTDLISNNVKNFTSGGTHLYRAASVLIKKPLVYEFAKRRLLEETVLEQLISIGKASLSGTTQPIIDTSFITAQFISSVRDIYTDKKDNELRKREVSLREFLNNNMLKPVYGPRGNDGIEFTNYDYYYSGYYITTSSGSDIRNTINSFTQGKTQFFNTQSKDEFSLNDIDDVISVNINSQSDDISTASVVIKNDQDKYSFTADSADGVYRIGDCIIEPQDEIYIFLPNKKGQLKLSFSGFVNSVTKRNEAGYHSIQVDCECLYKMMRMTRTNLMPSTNKLEAGDHEITGWNMPPQFYDKPIESCLMMLGQTYSNMFSQLSDSDDPDDHPLLKYLVTKVTYSNLNYAALVDLLEQYTGTILYGKGEPQKPIKGIYFNKEISKSNEAIDKQIATYTKEINKLSKENDDYSNIYKEKTEKEKQGDLNTLLKRGDLNAKVLNAITDTNILQLITPNVSDTSKRTSKIDTTLTKDQIRVKINANKAKIEKDTNEINKLRKQYKNANTVYDFLSRGGSALYVVYKELPNTSSEYNLSGLTFFSTDGRHPIAVFSGISQLVMNLSLGTIDVFNSNWQSHLDILRQFVSLFNFTMYTDPSGPTLRICPPNFSLYRIDSTMFPYAEKTTGTSGNKTVTSTSSLSPTTSKTTVSESAGTLSSSVSKTTTSSDSSIDATSLTGTTQTLLYARVNSLDSIDAKNSPYCLTKNSIINIDEKEDDTYLFDWAPLVGKNMEATIDVGEANRYLNRLTVYLPQLIDKYGYRMKKEESYPNFDDTPSLYFYGLGLLERQNKNYRSGTATIIGDADVQVNNSVIIDESNKVYYVSNISYIYVAGDSYTQSLTLLYGRKPVASVKSLSDGTIDLENTYNNIVDAYIKNLISPITYLKYKYFLNPSSSVANLTPDAKRAYLSYRILRNFVYDEIMSHPYEETMKECMIDQSLKEFAELYSRYSNIIGKTDNDSTKGIKLMNLFNSYNKSSFDASNIYGFIIPNAGMLNIYKNPGNSKFQSTISGKYSLKDLKPIYESFKSLDLEFKTLYYTSNGMNVSKTYKKQINYKVLFAIAYILTLKDSRFNHRVVNNYPTNNLFFTNLAYAKAAYFSTTDAWHKQYLNDFNNSRKLDYIELPSINIYVPLLHTGINYDTLDQSRINSTIASDDYQFMHYYIDILSRDGHLYNSYRITKKPSSNRLTSVQLNTLAFLANVSIASRTETDGGYNTILGAAIKEGQAGDLLDTDTFLDGLFDTNNKYGTLLQNVPDFTKDNVKTILSNINTVFGD